MISTPLDARAHMRLLETLFSSATDRAAAAMRRWTSGAVSLTLQGVTEIPLEAVCDHLGVADELLTMVVLEMLGDLGGGMILVFDEENGHKLADSLLATEPNDAEPWSELEKSALAETGNILGCAFVSALTQLSDSPLVPSPPYFVEDYGASVLQQVLTSQALTQDRVLVCQIRFSHAEQDLNWHLLLVLSETMRKHLEELPMD